MDRKKGDLGWKLFFLLGYALWTEKGDDFNVYNSVNLEVLTDCTIFVYGGKSGKSHFLTFFWNALTSF